MSLSGKFSHFTLRHLNIINLPGSGEQLILGYWVSFKVGNVSSERRREAPSSFSR